MITKASLERTLPYLLRPLIRLCIRYGVTIQQVEQEVKNSFVHEASHLLARSELETSTSKISAMTGMQRPAISEILSKMPKPKPESLTAKVIGAWCAKKKYVTGKGRPRILGIEGKSSEFAELVAGVSRSLNPYTVLFELERARLIDKSPTGIRLKTESFNSRLDIEQSLRYLGADVRDLINAVEENLNSPDSSRNHHLTTEYDRIPIEYLERARKLLLVEGEKFHRRMRKVLSALDQDIQGKREFTKFVRVAVGSFSWCEEGE